GRYRLPAAPAIIILAAGLLATANWRTVFSPRRAWAVLKRHRWVALAALVLCSWVVAGAYSQALPSLLRSLYQSWSGDLALSLGDARSAFGQYELAQSAFPAYYWPARHE